MKRLFLFVLSLALAATAGAATITVTAPSDSPGMKNCKGNIDWIDWTKSGTMPNFVKITLRDAASLAEVEVIVESAPNTGSYHLWTIPPNTPDGKYKVRVKAIGAAVHGDSAAFKIQKCPALMLTDPFAGAYWNKTTTHLITWNAWGPYLPTVSLFLLNEQNQQVLTIAANIPNTHQYSWTIPGNLKSGKYYVLLKSTTTADQSLSGLFNIELAKIQLLPETKK